MMWKVKEKNGAQWYISDVCQLKIINNKDNYNIWVNYKGFNIAMPMGMWGFGEEVSERGIRYGIKGDSIEDWYFVVEKKDFDLFVDLIYFFIHENDADKMINPSLKIKKWN